MNSADSFSSDYQQARVKFRAAATEAGGVLEAMQHPERGPDGAALFTDVAWFGPRDSERVLVLIAGTHGVEGFCGSGAQVDLLRRGELAKLADGLAVLMIHAVNPYGFAWLRRVTHENVDLNRNWIDFAQPLPANAGYDELSAAICPAEWTDAARAAGDAVIAQFALTHGMGAMMAAASGGQYRHPAGIFYGGDAPSWSRKAQTAIFAEYLAGARTVGIIDYHTGLGPWGYGEQINTAPRNAASFRRAAVWYGAALASVADGTSASARIAGDGLSAAAALMPHTEVTGMALEIGTLPPAEVVLALRADAWLHAHGDPAAPQGQQIKRQIRDAFYGDRDDWKGMVAGQSLLAFRQAMSGLS